ncbi:uncharacterized protein LOC103718046 isoform X1 [Phoenix dactylifera]|uniref:Uncharacterized protein LOC103718046 isoform X1 n=1 Tax=Phoenix dactylifera TaxID=42345 RepID=A0A8B7CRM7_PHODC|nr:uncharacterized protein LOC103718046 isoform X1 [Phoenix dactylifera]
MPQLKQKKKKKKKKNLIQGLPAREEEAFSSPSKKSMALASPQHAFLTGNPLSSIPKPTRRSLPPLLLSFRCSMEKESGSSGRSEMKLAKLGIVTLAAGVLTLGSVHDAMAAKSGGRVGGQAFRSAAPRSSGPRINNSRTNVFINPPMAPPLVGGYGYGVPFYGGWGWSPFTFFAPGPSIAVGIGGGFEVFAAFLVLGAIAAVIRRFTGWRDGDEDDY